MTEREAAVAWLERDYDEEMNLAAEDDVIGGESVRLFWVPGHVEGHIGPMFYLKDQNA
ncbi:MBL fold metallo-hydrolase [Streptomyces mirabilis]|uniref:hypothetical protein n=1 Tax=Streptomyces mirabilis TaxID=68239 RepID=UPI0036D8C9E3